jgi:hypothetical protein
MIKMKKLSTIIMALALVLGMSQCKKQETPTNGNGGEGEMVHITLNVNDSESLAVNVNDNGGRHAVAPSLGVIQFTNGDKLYVGNNGHYVGYLQYVVDQSGRRFDGYIDGDKCSTNDKLHFYFLGGKEPATAPTAGTTTDFPIDIANQSQNLPVLCYGKSNENYSTNGSYTASLAYKCALVKFNLNKETSYSCILSNMPTEATISFATTAGDDFTPIAKTSTTGNIDLYREEGNTGVRWAILLPGTNLSDDGNVSGAPSGTLNANQFINSGITLTNPVFAAPNPTFAVKTSGGVMTQFSVSPTQKVYFSKANLRFVDNNNNTGGWSFHENQVDASSAWPEYGDSNIDIPSGESTNDRFAWGLYGNHGMYEDDWPAITPNLSKADGNDWGCAFSATSPEGGNWRTLTIDEWNYLFNGRSQQKRFLKVTLKMEGTPNAVQGILLFPDGYVEPAGLTKTFTYNSNTSTTGVSGYVVADGDKFVNATVYTDPSSNSYKMLAAGAVFLPAAGYRIQQWYQMYYCHQPGAYTGSLNWDAYGYYWSSTSGVYNEFSHTSRAFYFDRSRVGEATSYQDRSHGMCVRLVWDAN